MISGIHLATALSVMLHMEQEGNGMETKELIGKLRHLVSLDRPENGGPFQGAAARECVSSMKVAYDRLSEQQQVIEELVGAIEGMLALSVTGKASNAARKSLSRAKGHTKDAE